MARRRDPVDELRRRATAPWRAMPGYVVVGAMKAGTTSLYHCLRQHPDVVAAERKQVHWLDLAPERSASWYRSHFPLRRNVPDGGMTGEATPYYLAHPDVPGRARDRLPPTTRFVALLRDPVDRLLSQHRHQVALGREPPSLAEVVDAELAGGQELEAAHPPGSPGHQGLYLLRGRYAEQLERWFAAVGRERMLVLRTVDLAANPDGTLDRVVAHLGLRPHAGWRPQHRNASPPTSAPPDPEVLARLDAYYAPHDEALRRLTGVDVTRRPRRSAGSSGTGR